MEVFREFFLGIKMLLFAFIKIVEVIRNGDVLLKDGS